MEIHSYDERKTKNKLIIPQERNENNKTYTEMIEILSSDNINIIGLLDEPYNKSYYNLPNKLINNSSVFKKRIYDDQWSKLQKVKKKNLKIII